MFRGTEPVKRKRLSPEGVVLRTGAEDQARASANPKVTFPTASRG